MSHISTLYGQIGQQADAASWLRQAGNVFEKAGDIEGLGKFYCTLAAVHREEDLIDDALSAYRKVLSLIDGRHFPLLAAQTHLELGVTLSVRREYSEAQKHLDRAEIICKRHHIEQLLQRIGLHRSHIEKELQIAQVPKYTIAELLRSLEQLLLHSPRHATAYLPFWYFAWQSQLLAAMRSGPGLTFSVVTDDIERFLRFVEKCSHLGGLFLMNTTRPATIAVDRELLPIPPDWKIPENFQYVLVRNKSPMADVTDHGDDRFDTPPGSEWPGPTRALPLYMPCRTKSDSNGIDHVLAQSTQHLPQEGIDLMLGRPVETLIQLRAIWLPSQRPSSKDAFLYDLRGARDREVFPIYLDQFPSSEAVADCGGIQFSVPLRSAGADTTAQTQKWCRALLKLGKLPKEQAQIALLDLPDTFSGSAIGGETNTIPAEVHLFEFGEKGQRFLRPALLFRIP